MGADRPRSPGGAPAHRSLRRDALRGVKWRTVEVWSGQLVGLTVFLLLARYLTPDDFGLIALAAVVIALLQTFMQQGLVDAIVQREDLEELHLHTAFWVQLATSIALGGALALGAPLIADWLREPRLEDVLRGLSPLLALGAMAAVPSALLNRTLAFRPLAVCSLVAHSVGGAVGIVWAVRGGGVWSLVVHQLSTQATLALVLWGASRWRPALRFSIPHLRQLSRFGVNIVLIYVLNFLNRKADDLLIGVVLGTTALGYYTIGYKLLLVMLALLPGAVSSVAFPVFARMQLDRRRLERAFLTVTRLGAAVICPVFIGIAVLAPELVVALFGEQWGPSGSVARVLALIGVLQGLLYFVDSSLYALGRPSWKLALTAVNAVANVIAFAIAVRWGILAVAVAYVLRGYLFSPLPLLAMRRLIGLRVLTYLRQVAPGLALSGLMALVVLATKHWLGQRLEGAALTGVCVLTGIVAYTSLLFVLAPTLARELWSVLSGALVGGAKAPKEGE